jgi:hypothetical protein
MNKNIEVFLNNEYGYKTYIWKPEMTESEFVDWWKNLTDSDIIKYYFNLKSLPGKLKPAKTALIGNAKKRVSGDPADHTPHYYCHLHDVGDSFVYIGDEKIPHIKTSRRDWKENWIDYQIKNSKPEEVFE